MAKKKSEDGEFKGDIDSLINKKYGDVIRNADEILEQNLEVFSTGSPNIDFAIGGGIQEGSVVEVCGLPKVGKTSLCLQSLSNFMAKGRDCYFIDAESRFDKKNLQIHGLDPKKLKIIRSEEGHLLTATTTLDLIDDIIKSQKGCAIVLDSLSTLISDERATTGVDGQRRDTRPKTYSDWIVGISPHIRINRVTLFIIRHYGTNTSGNGPKYSPDGGLKVSFRKDVSLHCKWHEKWKQGEKFLGNIMHFAIDSSNFACPVENVDTYLRFGYGIDEEKEMVSQAIDYGILEKSGSWLTLNFLDEPVKMQGEEKVIEFLKENPESYKILQNKIKELLI